MARYRIDPACSRVAIDARSSLHPIHSETDGVEGWLDVELDGERLDPAVAPRAHLELPVDRLRSGNLMEDRELKRRIDARRFPTITGDLVTMEAIGDGRYLVGGDVTFRGVTRARADEMTVTVDGADTLRLRGTSVFDIRHF